MALFQQIHIGQVFTSTVAGGYYGAEAALGLAVFRRVSRQLLRAAYFGTLLAAAVLGKTRAVLTLIGGGAFNNPVDLIWQSIVWALEQVEPLLSQDLEVVLNGRDLSSVLDLDAIVLPEVRRRGGVILVFDDAGLIAVRR